MNKDILQVAHLMKTYSYRGVTTEATRNVSFVVSSWVLQAEGRPHY